MPLLQAYSLRNPHAKLGEVGHISLPPLGLRPRGWKGDVAQLPSLREGVRPSLYPQLTKCRDSLYLQLVKGRDCLYLSTLPTKQAIFAIFVLHVD